VYKVGAWRSYILSIVSANNSSLSSVLGTGDVTSSLKLRMYLNPTTKSVERPKLQHRWVRSNPHQSRTR